MSGDDKKRVLTAENLHLHNDEQIRTAIECFGRLWNPWEQQCVPCLAQLRCLHRVANVTLPQEALERGAYDPDHATGQLFPRPERLDLNELAPELQTDVRALQYALQYAKDSKMGLPVIQPNGMLQASMGGPPKITDPKSIPAPAAQEELETPEQSEEEEAMQAVADDDEELEEVTDDDLDAGTDIEEENPDEDEEEIEVEVLDVPRVKEEVVVKVKKPAVKKAAAALKKITAAEAKKLLKDKAPGKATILKPKKEKKVRPQKAAAEISAEEFDRRFQKDCQKYPLPVGTTLTKTVGGVARLTKKEAKGWRYDGQLYPTLPAVSMAQGNAKEILLPKRPDGTRPDGTRMNAVTSATNWFPTLTEQLEKPTKKGKK